MYAFIILFYYKTLFVHLLFYFIEIHINTAYCVRMYRLTGNKLLLVLCLMSEIARTVFRRTCST